LEFLSEGNVLSANDNISGGSVDVFLSHGMSRNEHCFHFLFHLMVAIFVESTGVHEKPEMMLHVMEDGSTESFKFWSRG
jgi:hypothetical protein